MFRHSSKIRGLRSTNCSLQNTSKLAIFYVEENPCRFFSSWFPAALHFYLMNALVYVWKYPSYVYNLCTSSILAQCDDPKFCVVVIMLLSRLLLFYFQMSGCRRLEKSTKSFLEVRYAKKAAGEEFFVEFEFLKPSWQKKKRN